MIWRVSKVLQVTVQVKRQILSAVWRKALEVPTVQREKVQFVWNTRSGLFEEKCVEWSDRVTTLLRPRVNAGQRADTTSTRSEPTKDKTQPTEGDRGHISCHFSSELSVFSFHVQMAKFCNQRQNYIYQTTLWPNMWKRYRDFLRFLFLGSSEWRQFVQLMSDESLLYQICWFTSRSRMIWDSKQLILQSPNNRFTPTFTLFALSGCKCFF